MNYFFYFKSAILEFLGSSLFFAVIGALLLYTFMYNYKSKSFIYTGVLSVDIITTIITIVLLGICITYPFKGYFITMYYLHYILIVVTFIIFVYISRTTEYYISYGNFPMDLIYPIKWRGGVYVFGKTVNVS